MNWKWKELYDKKRMYGKTYAFMEKKTSELGMSGQDFANVVIKELLGDDWYVVDPIPAEQINIIALEEILEKYSPRKKDKGPKICKYDSNISKIENK